VTVKRERKKVSAHPRRLSLTLEGGEDGDAFGMVARRMLQATLDEREKARVGKNLRLVGISFVEFDRLRFRGRDSMPPAPSETSCHGIVEGS
jgi:hypothetical protein